MDRKALVHKAKMKALWPVRYAMKGWSFWWAFPRAYLAAAEERAVDERKVRFVDQKADHDAMPDAFELMMPYVRDRYDMNVRYVGLGQTAGIGWGAYYKRCLQLARDMADAKYVFLADASDVVSCLPLRTGIKIV